jgi:hypothetical protein
MTGELIPDMLENVEVSRHQISLGVPMDATEIFLLRLVLKNPGSDKSAVAERALPLLYRR